jgi:hypothetical protein
VILLRKSQIFAKFCGTKDAPGQPIIGEMAGEAGQMEDIDADTQDGHRRAA